MKPKILFAINSLAGGGAERVLTTLVRASRSKLDRYDMGLVLLDHEQAIYELPDWLTLYQLDSRHGFGRSVRQLWALVGKLSPDVMVSFLTRANVATSVAMGLRRRPFILSERVNTTAHLKNARTGWASRMLVRWSYPHASRVISVSTGVAETLIRDYQVPANRIEVIYNPVDLDQIETSRRQPPPFEVFPNDVVAMGRLTGNKNFPLAIAAFARSGRSGRLVLLGEGPDREELRRLGDRLGLGDRLLMPGFVGDPHAVIARSAFFILSSNAEGFSNSLVEAMACGVPVVSTDCRSSPAEILQVDTPPKPGQFATGAGGLLVPPDDVEAMARAIVHMGEASVHNELADRARDRVRDFDVERAVDRYWRVIEAVLANPGGSAPELSLEQASGG